MLKLVLPVLFCLSLNTWAAPAAPSIGLVVDAVERHSIRYDCSQAAPDEIACSFMETAVRQDQTIADLPDAIEKARREFAQSSKPFDAKECETARDIADVLDGKKPSPKAGQLDRLSTVERTDAIRMTQGFIAYCDKPTEANYLAIARSTHEKSRRTCSVSSHSWTMSFKAQATGQWLAKDASSGACGILSLARFEPEDVALGDNTITKWRFVSQKAVTNPSGDFTPYAKCSGLDLAAHSFDWRPQEHQVSCDYIHFVPL